MARVASTPDPLPLVLTHGWPGSFVEFEKIIPLLSDPTAHGGDAADAFDLVIPWLPGYGFSGSPTRAGTGPAQIGALWAKLMAGLGYDRYGAQGGDWGAAVTTAVALADAAHIAGIHQNFIFRMPQPPVAAAELNEAERAYMAEVRAGRMSRAAMRISKARDRRRLAIPSPTRRSVYPVGLRRNFGRGAIATATWMQFLLGTSY
jgi:pimeloyl-ACP methyl ester carboxylesterase